MLALLITKDALPHAQDINLLTPPYKGFQNKQLLKQEIQQTDRGTTCLFTTFLQTYNVYIF